MTIPTTTTASRECRHEPSIGLHVGEWVVVRSQEEILATLDDQGRLEGLPFQAEQLAFCGKRMRVAKSAHKTCDTIHKTGGRRMHNAVHLEGARCDGALHGGCQADCVFYWKEAWIKRDGASAAPAGKGCTVETIRARVKAPGQENEADPVWVCQTTALFDATTPLKWWDARQYVKDVATGNHGLWHMSKLLIAAWYRNLVKFGVGYRVLVGFYNAFQKVTGGRPFPEAAGPIPDGKPTPVEKLDLKVGEWIEVKSGAEIIPTLTVNGFNRGMRYDMEMLKYSGGRYRVQMLVDRLISETTGKMMVMKTPCIQLEDVYCRAECTPMRIGCPRASNSYWREIWLKRVPGPKA